MSKLPLNDTEFRVLELIRSMELFDKVEIKYSKQGELQWTLTKSTRGVYFTDMRGV